MSTIIQVTMLNGNIVENARWEVDSVDIKDGHMFQISIPTDDTKLLRYLNKHTSSDISVDKISDDKTDRYSVILNCVVKQTRHLLESSSSQMSTMVMVIPANRFVESIMMYMVQHDNCDPRIVKLINSDI